MTDRELMALVKEYLDHRWSCAVSRDIRSKYPVWSSCDCGYDKLLVKLAEAGL